MVRDLSDCFGRGNNFSFQIKKDRRLAVSIRKINRQEIAATEAAPEVVALFIVDLEVDAGLELFGHHEDWHDQTRAKAAGPAFLLPRPPT